MRNNINNNENKNSSISILIFYEANFVARKTRAPFHQSSPNFPNIFSFTVPNAIEILFFQIHPTSGVMGQSSKVKGSEDSPCEMEAREREEGEEREERDNRTCLNDKSKMVDNLNTAELRLTKLPKYIFFFSILIFYEANFVARKTRASFHHSSPNFPNIFVFTIPNAIEILFPQIHPTSGVMGQSSKVKGSVDSPYEMEAREREEGEEREERDNRTCLNNKSKMVDNLNTAELRLTKLPKYIVVFLLDTSINIPFLIFSP